MPGARRDRHCTHACARAHTPRQSMIARSRLASMRRVADTNAAPYAAGRQSQLGTRLREDAARQTRAAAAMLRGPNGVLSGLSFHRRGAGVTGQWRSHIGQILDAAPGGQLCFFYPSHHARMVPSCTNEQQTLSPHGYMVHGVNLIANDGLGPRVYRLCRWPDGSYRSRHRSITQWHGHLPPPIVATRTTPPLVETRPTPACVCGCKFRNYR